MISLSQAYFTTYQRNFKHFLSPLNIAYKPIIMLKYLYFLALGVYIPLAQILKWNAETRLEEQIKKKKKTVSK